MVYWPNDSKLPAVYDVSSVAQFSHVRWTAGPMTGFVYSTTILNGKLYFLTSRETKDIIVCVNPDNGEVLWEYESALPIPGYITFSADTAYYIEDRNRLVALSLESRTQKWVYEVAKRVRTLPVVANGAVYVGSSDKGVHAVDAETGEQKWVFYTKGEVRCPQGIGPDGTVYAGSFDTRLYALAAESGEMKWYYWPKGPEENRSVHNVICSRPAVAYETVYFGSNNFYLYALDSKTGREKWKFQGGDWIRTFPLAYDNKIYFACYKALSGDPYSNAFYCLDAHTGEVEWCKYFPDIFSGPYIADGRVFIRCQDGIFRALNIGTGEEEWRFGTEGGWAFDPAFADGAIYLPWSDQDQPEVTYPKLYALATTK